MTGPTAPCGYNQFKQTVSDISLQLISAQGTGGFGQGHNLAAKAEESDYLLPCVG